jgi:hypothetical protein
VVYLSYSLLKNKHIITWGDKNNYYINYTNHIKEIYPKARFIHIIRDGRDVACSYIALNNLKTKSQYKPSLPIQVKKIAKEWHSNNLNILNFFEKVDGNLKISIKFEDLIEYPEKIMRTVCQLIGISYEQDMLRFYQNPAEPLELIDWKLKTLEAIDHTNKNKYFTLLTNKQIREFNSIAQTTLQSYGYKI